MQGAKIPRKNLHSNTFIANPEVLETIRANRTSSFFSAEDIWPLPAQPVLQTVQYNQSKKLTGIH